MFSEGGLAGPAPIVAAVMRDDLNKNLRITKTNTVVMPSVSNNPAGLTLSLTASSGSFRGVFTLKNDPDPTDKVTPISLLSRTGSYFGVLVPRLGVGVGQFQLDELPSTGPPATTLFTSPQLSGQVVLEGATP